jgi:DNA-binding SARP family transcriptional activator/Flp pilus assembly protein TadD
MPKLRNGPGITVRFEVLGPLRAWRGTTELSLGAVQQRVVLAVLLINANRPLSREHLVDAVWGSEAPTYAVNLLQKHVSGLRRVLEPVRLPRAPSQFLAWTDVGYLLTAPPECLDMSVFDQELDHARAFRAAGDLNAAAEALRAALRLWRGPLCDGLTSPLLDTERERLAERRTSAAEERIEVDLALGGHLDVIDELRWLVAEHPLRERLRGLLMLALYRSGRQAEALTAFQDARRYLRDELGIEPSAQLQQLHQNILTADETLAAPTATAGVALARPGPNRDHKLPVPAQLPHGMPDFAGRTVELKRLHSLLNGDDSTVVISAIGGTAGVGKTTLAVQWAHQIRDRFPDGQLYVNLRGFDSTGSVMDPAEAIRGFLDAYGVPSEQIPVSLDGQAALYRSLLAGKRVLVVLDNARDVDQIRQLLPGTRGCLAVVTSRKQLTGLVATEGAQFLALGLLTTAEARELLARRLGPERIAAEPKAVDEITAFCVRLPLALAIVAARAVTHPQFSLAALADELRETRGSLDAFADEDKTIDIRAVFSWSYQRLSVTACRLFRLLGLHPGPDLSTAAAASLAGCEPAQIRPALAELTGAHLIIEHTSGRFSFHDLLRTYAAELAHTVDTNSDRLTAIHRMLDHYLHTAYAADRLLNPNRDPLHLVPPQSEVNLVSLVNRGQALTWFTAEHSTLLAAVNCAASTGFDTHTWQLAWALTTFFDYQGHWHDQAATQRTALDATLRRADRLGQAHAHRGLGFANARLGRFNDALTHYQQSLDLFGELGDLTGQARTHHALARAFDRVGRNWEALHHVQQALNLYQAAGHRAGQAAVLNAIGWNYARLGHYEQALIYCQQALSLNLEIGARDGQAQTWDSLGYVHYHLGQYAQAVSCYHHALDLIPEFGERNAEADALTYLGDAYYANGDLDSAHTAWQRALTILDQLSQPTADQVRAKLNKLRDPHSKPDLLNHTEAATLPPRNTLASCDHGKSMLQEYSRDQYYR